MLNYESKLESIEVPNLENAICEKEEVHEEALNRLKYRKVQQTRQHEWEVQFRIKSRELQQAST